MPQTSAKEHVGKVCAKRVDVSEAGGLKVNGVPVSPAYGGQATVTGAGTITLAFFNVITSVVASLGQVPAAGESYVTSTWTGNVVTLTVYTSADAVSTTATIVNYIATGN